MAPKRKATVTALTQRSKRVKIKTGTDVADTTKPLPTLLGLPPELRNRISSYVLQESDRIVVTPSLREPGNLSTNHQIRSEARGLWYYSNEFGIEVWDCNADIVKAFHKYTVAPDSKRPMRISMCLRGIPHWENLVRWCPDCHSRRSWRCPAGAGGSKLYMIAGAVQELVHVTATTEKLDWETCLKALNQLRIVMGCADKCWLD